jgi:hypothetical protein
MRTDRKLQVNVYKKDQTISQEGQEREQADPSLGLKE